MISTSPPVTIPNVPITDYVLRHAVRLGDKPALIDGPTGRTLTYRQLADGVRRTAREVGHEKGDGDSEVLDTSTPLAVLITQLNTVAAFATLAVANHRGLFSMGVLLGISIFFVLIVSLIVLPSFMIAIGVGQPKPAK